MKINWQVSNESMRLLVFSSRRTSMTDKQPIPLFRQFHAQSEINSSNAAITNDAKKATAAITKQAGINPNTYSRSALY
jgi:hypothetical protein